MINKFTLLLAVFILSLSTYAQNSVQLMINHKLGDQDFAFSMGAKNNIDHDFNVSRLEYYISEITITHDGGMTTPLKDVYILVDASQSRNISLGSYAINEVEGISFHIGVDSLNNHADPAAFPAGHPLAPQFPSMHWGWASGYRFIAMEGKGGPNYNQVYNLHGLGDNNYFETQLSLSASAANHQINIAIDADYTRVLEDIAVNTGVIVHGDFGDAQKAIENFRDYVFSPAESTTSTVDFSEINSFSIFPNPTVDGVSTVAINATEDLNYSLSVTDILGRPVEYFGAINSNSSTELQFKAAGIYFINLIKEGQTIISEKLIVK